MHRLINCQLGKHEPESYCHLECRRTHGSMTRGHRYCCILSYWHFANFQTSCRSTVVVMERQEELKLPDLFSAPFAFTPVSQIKSVQRPANSSSSSYEGNVRQSGHECTLPLPFKSFAVVGGRGRHYLLHLYSVTLICVEVLRVTCCANQCTNADSRLYCVFLETESPCPPHLIVSLCYTSRPQYSFFRCTRTGFGLNLHTANIYFVHTSS